MTGEPRRWARPLSEFVVIVVGVLVALGVDEWRANRAGRRLERDYVQRLQADLTRSREQLDLTLQRLAGAARNAQFITPYVAGAAPLPGDTITVVAALYRASRSLAWSAGTWLPRTTFLDLQTSGRIGLIRDPSVRAAIIDYYVQVDGLASNLDLLPSEYRDFVRRRLPAEVQRAIRMECSVFEPELRCAADLAAFNAASFLQEVRGNAELVGDLRLSHQQLEISVELLATVMAQTDSLASLLSAYGGP
jgi:hypothetical protein